MQVYVEVSSNHNIPIEEVIRGKFTPPIRLLINYYNTKFRTEEKEYKKMKEKKKKKEREVNK